MIDNQIIKIRCGKAALLNLVIAQIAVNPQAKFSACGRAASHRIFGTRTWLLDHSAITACDHPLIAEAIMEAIATTIDG